MAHTPKHRRPLKRFAVCGGFTLVEVLVVLTGALRMHVEGEVHDLAAGDSICFPADRPHIYENPGGSEARYHNLIAYER